MFVLIILALGLTIAMFMSKNLMLGFPSAIFWAILGAYAYTQSTTPWGDWQYYLFFASMGMVIFCMFAAYALRSKDTAGADADEGKFVDEEPEPDLRGNVETGSADSGSSRPRSRSQRIRDRANRRRTEGVQKKTDWGEFK